MRGWKLSARRALESLAFSSGASDERLGQEALARRLLSQSTVLELDALPAAAKKFFIPLLCLWLFFAKLAGSRREQLDLVIVVEEAHHVLYRQEHKAKESLMNMLLRQCRELGIGMIVVDQHPHLISSAALGNTHTSICLNLKDPSDINKAAGLSLVSEAEKACFSLLPVGQGVVKLQSRWHRPFLVQFPLVPLHKGVMTDSRLRQRLAGLATRSAPKWPQGGSVDRVRHVRPEDTPLDSGAAALLHDVARHRDDGVRARYARLGMSAGRGNRLKDALVRGGWVEEEVVPRGRTRTVLLRLTAAGRALLPRDGAQPDATPRESVAHEYWKRHYERVLRQRGYEVQVEAPRHGGRADLLAKRQGQRLAVEVETGKSDVVSNVKNSLRSGCERVIVVATSGEAQDAVERQLGTAGLLIRGRVDIVVCGQLPARLDEAGHEA